MPQTLVTSPYADYNFYLISYRGNRIKDLETFERMEERAEEELDSMTFDRIKTMKEKFMSDDLAMKIRKCVCAMTEVLQSSEEIPTGINSESNDGYSVSYSTTAYTDTHKTMKNTAFRYLGDSGLLYRGGGDWHDD